LTTAVIFSVLQPTIIHLLEWWLPSDQHEDLSKPELLYEEALSEPATALDLIEKEHVPLPVVCWLIRRRCEQRRVPRSACTPFASTHRLYLSLRASSISSTTC